MADLVRVLVNGQETNVSPAWATKKKLQVLDEPTHRGDGTVRRPTRKGGRPLKPRVALTPASAEQSGGPSYADLTVPELKNLIEARNDALGDEEPQIVVPEPGNKPELIAALEADDAR